jgi:hypothetical protein
MRFVREKQSMKKNKSFVLLLAGYLIFILAFSGNPINVINSNNSMNYTQKIENILSSDPGSPTNLPDDSEIYESSYSSSQNYYYDTYEMSYSDYHLIWLYSVDPLDDFDLYLYSSSSYSSTYFFKSSTSTDNVDWIVYNPSFSRKIYPMVDPYDSGDGIIGAESGHDGEFGVSYTVCSGSQEIGDMYQFELYMGYEYVISLTVPSDTNLDLYAYYLSGGESADYDEYENNSASEILGDDEEIVIANPRQTELWAFVIIKKEGTGSGTFTITQTMQIPSFEFIPVFGALIIAIYVSILFLNKKPKVPATPDKS